MSVFAAAHALSLPVLPESSDISYENFSARNASSNLDVRDTERVIDDACMVLTALGGFIGGIGVAAMAAHVGDMAHHMKRLADKPSCDPFNENIPKGATDGSTVYAHVQPYTTGSDCGTTAEYKTIHNALISAVNELHQGHSHAGCCTFSHGGSWHAHVKFKVGQDVDFSSISCPSSAT